jgi:hypothetical protein
VLNDVSTGQGAYRYYGYAYGYGEDAEREPVAQVPATTGSSAS